MYIVTVKIVLILSRILVDVSPLQHKITLQQKKRKKKDSFVDKFKYKSCTVLFNFDRKRNLKNANFGV